MTASGDSSVSYLCPRCQAALTAQAEDTGQRRECPSCGKMIKVPGSRTHKPSPDKSGAATEEPHQGLANILVVCPYCDTRMHASDKQIGQSIVCPDCLESVVVQVPETRRRRTDAMAGQPETPAKQQPDDAGAEHVDDDELTLSEPIDVPAETLLPKTLSDLIGDLQTPVPGGQTADHPPSDTGSAAEPTAPQPFVVNCPICDGRIYATEGEIGGTKNCPDCFSPVEVRRPKPKPQRVSDVVEADYEGDLFTLSQPEELEVYKKDADDLVAKTVGEQALSDALQRRRAREAADPDLPNHPFWTRIFKFLADPLAVLRLLGVAGLVLLQLKLGVQEMIRSRPTSACICASRSSLAASVFAIAAATC